MNQTVLVAGSDTDGIATALEAAGADVRRAEGVLSADVLVAAGVDDVDVYVLTDLDEATSIPVVVERNPDARIVVYSRRSLPEFVKGQTDIAVDPALLDASVVADELVNGAA